MNLKSYNWNTLNKKIYYSDGSLRDIYVTDITRIEWSKWINYVNSNFEIKFYNGKSNKIENSINENIVFDYWDEETDLCNNALIKIQNINLMCYFFSEFELENDIWPSEIKSINEHNRLMNYLKNISILLSKEVFLTEENAQSLKITPLITVKNEIIIFDPDNRKEL